MQIALFGTSADPPTNAHLAILNYLAETYDRTLIWAAENPFKPNQTPLHHRTQMLQLLLQNIPPTPKLQLAPELSHSRTWHTLEQAQQQWPDAQFTLVVGADIVPQLPSWYRSRDLLQAVSLLLIPREGYEIQASDLETLEQLGTNYTIAPLITPPIASSHYRNEISRATNTRDRASPQTTGPHNIVPPNIQNYIDQHHLYSPTPTTPVCQAKPNPVHP
jgi:nicotinate-nucleotide adenylyltransferase